MWNTTNVVGMICGTSDSDCAGKKEHSISDLRPSKYCMMRPEASRYNERSPGSICKIRVESLAHGHQSPPPRIHSQTQNDVSSEKKFSTVNRQTTATLSDIKIRYLHFLSD